MRVARWRWLLVPMVVLVAGCLPGATPALPAPPDLPASFTTRPWTFTTAPPSAGTLSAAEVVVALQARGGQDTSLDYLRSRAVPIFGLLRCPAEVKECQALGIPEQPQAVWLVLYPDAAQAGGHGIGWAMVDAITGVDGMFMTHSPQN